MKQRVLWKMFLLEFVTFGIYRLYYLVSTRNEMIKRDPNVKIKSPWFLLAPIIVIIISLFVVIGSVIASAGKVRDCQANQPVTSNSVSTSAGSSVGDTDLSTTPVDTPTTTTTTSTACPGSTAANVTGLGAMLVFYIGIFVAFIMYIIWLWGYCHGVEITTSEKLSFPVSLVIMILVPDGIDILIIQDSFNKLGAGPALAMAGGAPMPPTSSPTTASFSPTITAAAPVGPVAPVPAPDHSVNQAPTITPPSTSVPPAQDSQPSQPPQPAQPSEPPTTPGAGPTITPSA